MPRQAKIPMTFEFVLLGLLGILLGIPYALTKISLATIAPLTLVAARVSLAAVALWIVVFVLKCKLPKDRRLIPRLFIQGILACVLPYTLLAFGQRAVDSGVAAILNSTTPLFVCVVNPILARSEKVAFARLFGVSLGFAGVVIIAGASALSGLGQSTLGQAAIILATLASAVSVIHARRFADIPTEITAAGTLTAAALILVPLCFTIESPLKSAPSAAAVVALFVNAIVVTAFGFVIYFRLIRTIGSMGTASASYLKPAVGVLIGIIFMGESLTWSGGVGLLAILVGVAAINRGGLSNMQFRREFASRRAERLNMRTTSG
jgi:drug/metabolite transporter (DMT)-like permease